MRYWGDSIYAAVKSYRKNTPLQCTIAGAAVAQMMIFGLMGIDLKPTGNIQIAPKPTALASSMSLTGLRIRGTVLNIATTANTFTVERSGKSLSAPLGTGVLFDPVVGGLLKIDLRFDGFDATDRLFAASGDTVYWQSGNQFRRGVVTNTGPNWKLDIDLRFDGFDATDRLFAASGDTVFWQAARQFRRGQVA